MNQTRTAQQALLVCLASTLLLAPASGANIRKIEIRGLRTIGQAQLVRAMPLRTGSVFDEKEAEAAREWLLDRGVFLDVKLSVTTVGQVVDVVYTVVENPIVRAVMFVGNEQISSAALRDIILTRPREVLNRRNLLYDARAIGAEYVKLGIRVAVEESFDPPPTKPEPPVTVTFHITEFKLGRVRLEGLSYVNLDALGPALLLHPGDLLRDERIAAQRQVLLSTGLFQRVGEERLEETDQPGVVDLVYPVTEASQPLLTRDTLPMVDTQALCRAVTLSAVRLDVDTHDLALYLTPEEIAERLAAARARTGPEAAYEVAYWTLRSGTDPTAAIDAATRVLAEIPEAQRTPRQRLQLGQLAHWRRDSATADRELSAATSAPDCRIEAYKELLYVRAAATRRQAPDALEQLRRTALDGVEAVLDMPADADLETVTNAFQFYYAALAYAGLNIGVKEALRFDGPLGARLVRAVQQRLAAGASPAERAHLGKLLVAAIFAAKAAGIAGAGEERGVALGELLGTVRSELLAPGIATAAEPAAPFFLALCNLLINDGVEARRAALDGLRLWPTNERLVDVYLASLLGGQAPDQEAAKALRDAVTDVERARAAGELPAYSAHLLVAKLQLGLRTKLPEQPPEPREAARRAAAEAAKLATEAEPTQPGGWWMLGMALLKGPAPGEALAVYEKLATLPRRPAETDYALALARLAAGDLEGGLKAMEAIRSSRG